MLADASRAYLSIVKYNLLKSGSGATGRKVRVKRRGARSGDGGVSIGFGLMQSALHFIQACGGLEQAKSVLETVEQLRSVV